MRRAEGGRSRQPVLAWDHLTVDIRPFDPERLVEEWRWLVGDSRPVLGTAFGDLFLLGALGAEGPVHWLNTGDGTCVEVAGSTREFRGMLTDRTRILEWFIPDLVSELRASGVLLEPGECYSFVVPPFLGGAMEADNVAPMALESHLASTGRRRRLAVDGR